MFKKVIFSVDSTFAEFAAVAIQLGVLLVDCHTVGNPVFGADADGGALLIVIIADEIGRAHV